MSPACRTPNAAIPPFARAGTTDTPASASPSLLASTSEAPPHPSHGPPGPPRQLHPATTRLPWPRPAACLPNHRSPAARPTTQRGVCTIRRIATACRRRVAPLMLQFPPIRPRQPPPRPPPTTDHRPTPGRLPAQPPLTGPHPAAQRGFCTTRRTATACRRRVAPLMLQFPPLARANHGHARHQRRPTRPRPRASQSPGATGAPIKPYPLFRRNEIRPIQFVQTATN